MEELDAVCHLLLTLGPSYSTVVTALETMPEENLSMEFVKCRLLDEETKQRSVDSEKFPSNSDNAAFSGEKQPKKIRCFRCKKEGHKLVDCPERKKSANQKGQRNSKANVAESDRAGRDGVCFVSVSGCAAQQAHRTKWFIDSGASDHLVRDRELFTDLHRLKKPVEIAVAKDGECIVAEHSGTVKVISIVDGKGIECTVKNVLFIPQLRYNLFSVLRVEKAGMRVVFEHGKAQIYRGSEIVASGTRRESLYELDFQPIGQSEIEKSLLSCGRVQKNFELWHRRFGHLSEKNLEVLVRNDMVSGLKVDIDKNKRDVVVCESCIAGKQTRKPFSQSEERRSSRVLELVHTDVCGPVTPVGLFNSKFFVTFIDDWTHFTMVFLLESKSEVLRCFEQYEALATAKFGKRIFRLRCDNGGEYTGKRFKKFCAEKGIQLELTVPYTPEQNGVSERMNRTIVEQARAMLIDSGIGKEFWGQAVQTAAFLLNRSPTCAVHSKKTPFELWESKKPDVSKLKVFGCSAFVHVPSQLRKKLDSKSWRGIFLGYAPNGYRVWDPVNRRIVTARDVDFVETEIKEKARPVAVDQYIRVPTSGVPEDEEDKDSDDGDATSSADEYDSFRSDAEESAQEPGEAVGEDASGGENEARPQRSRAPPVWHKDFEVDYVGFALNAVSYVENIPGSIAELRKRDDWDSWRVAIEEEMDSLRRNNTWTLTELPAGRKPVTCKWVFRIKPGDGAVPERYKARLVARGFSQKPGFDYTETYSPVVKLDTLRMVLALANRDRLHVHQMDVRTAFLNGKLSEEIFMTQPDGFQQGKNLVCRKNRSIYGLKQASHAWNQRFHEFVKKLGFQQSANDHCLYTVTFSVFSRK